jgi:membrane-associated phospholipid phosphatase
VSDLVTILDQVTGTRLLQPVRGAGAVLRQATVGVRRRLTAPAPLHWRRELVLVAMLYLGYEASRSVADADTGISLANGRSILSWETTWHLDPERWLNHTVDHLPFLAVTSAYYYSVLHYVVTPAVLIWMFRSYSAHYRFARTALALSTVIGMVGFFLLPTAPPRLVPGSGIQDTLAQYAAWGWWNNHGSVPRGFAALSNQFAAMPSLHVGWAVWAGFLLWHFGRHRITRWIGVAYPVGTVLVVLDTGNHYLLDVVAGAVTIATAGGLALLWYGRSLVAEADAIAARAAHEALPAYACRQRRDECA